MPDGTNTAFATKVLQPSDIDVEQLVRQLKSCGYNVKLINLKNAKVFSPISFVSENTKYLQKQA